MWFIPNTLWTVKNHIAPEPTYTCHYYYYSTKTTLRKERSVRSKGSCILEMCLSLYSPFNNPTSKGIPTTAGHEKVSNQVQPEINALAHILLSDFQILRSQKNIFHIKNKIKKFFFSLTASLTAKQQQQIIVILVSASTPCIQYNEGTTRLFEANQRQVEWEAGSFV